MKAPCLLLIWAGVGTACGGDEDSPGPAEPPGAESAEPLEVEAPEPDPELRALELRLARIEDRVARLELSVAELLDEGHVDARQVRYDPRATRLEARNVHEALDELHGLVRSVERSLESPGRAGPGLLRMEGPDWDVPGQEDSPGGHPREPGSEGGQPHHQQPPREGPQHPPPGG